MTNCHSTTFIWPSFQFHSVSLSCFCCTTTTTVSDVRANNFFSFFLWLHKMTQCLYVVWLFIACNYVTFIFVFFFFTSPSCRCSLGFLRCDFRFLSCCHCIWISVHDVGGTQYYMSCCCWCLLLLFRLHRRRRQSFSDLEHYGFGESHVIVGCAQCACLCLCKSANAFLFVNRRPLKFNLSQC